MARLADALQRANRRLTDGDGALTPLPPPADRTPVAVALSRAPGVGPDRESEREPKREPKRELERGLGRGPERGPGRGSERASESAVPGATSLLSFLPADPSLTKWRTDPELVGKLVGTEQVSAGALEQYRKLAATLHHAQTERGIQVVMTASSLPGEGKSLTAANLALTLTESYHRRVLLIDADLRRPTVQRIFGLSTIDGLDEGLKAEHDRPMPVSRLSNRLFVLPAGRPDPDPLSGLTSDRMRRLVQQARGAFDWVIIDTPPVTLLPDANLLAACVDGVLLVVRAGKAPFHLVKRTVDTLGHDRILGIVMNAVDYAHDRNAGGYYEYYGYGYYGVSKGK